MKKVLFILSFLLINSFIYSANLYWYTNYPVEGSEHFSDASGQASVDEYVYANAGFMIDFYQFRYCVDGVWSDWITSDAYHILKLIEKGVYALDARAHVTYDIWGGGDYFIYVNTYRHVVITDQIAPAMPINLEVNKSSDNHPSITWAANTEHDFKNYKIYKKQNADGWYLLGTSTNTSFVDETETFVTSPTPEQIVHNVYYKIIACDINSNESAFSNELSVCVSGQEPPVSKKNSNLTQNSIITDYNLEQNYPNPFNPSTKISYQIPSACNVVLKVYNISGQEIATLVNQNKVAGYYTVNFNGSKLASGVYLYKIEAGAYTAVKKFILMK